jgi:putative SOS response-associated peptidase YedK
MCGRYFLYADKEVVIDAFNLDQELEYEKRYNIAPSQKVMAVVAGKKEFRAGYLDWGYPVFHQGKVKRVINARSENVRKSRVFESHFLGADA